MLRMVLFLLIPLWGVAEERSLSLLAKPPDWRALDIYQETITEEEFVERMDTLYAPHADWRNWFAVSSRGVAVVMHSAAPDLRYFIRFAEERPGETALVSKSLEGLHIAIDPGHIGGAFGPMEYRSFHIGESFPVQEGDLVLEVAKRLEVELEKRGAQVSLVRDQSQPVTMLRLPDLREEAERTVTLDYQDLEPGSEDWKRAVETRQQLLFYRVAEIRARAALINNHLHPDLVLALHFNAASWPDEAQQTLVEETHFHLLVNGAYMDSELKLDDVRFALLRKLLSREWERERELAVPLIEAFQEKTGLPPYNYSGKNAVPLLDNPYLYGRNLMANRLYRAPVLFLEPYVANSVADFARIQHFLMAEEADSPLENSIIEEYVNAVVSGLERWVTTE